MHLGSPGVLTVGVLSSSAELLATEKTQKRKSARVSVSIEFSTLPIVSHNPLAHLLANCRKEPLVQ